MRSPLVKWRESLEKITPDDDDQIYRHSDADDPVRRNSHSFAHSTSSSRSPLSNGIDSPYNMEDLTDLLEDKNRALSALKANYDSQVKELR